MVERAEAGVRPCFQRSTIGREPATSILKAGGIKVTDFGIAKAISSSRTKTGVILGTPNYMSPEQIMGQKIDPASDIFSLGIVFFQLLTGELPFKGDNLSNLLYEITQKRHQTAGLRRLPLL
jgi:serine/threonine protein kinase